MHCTLHLFVDILMQHSRGKSALVFCSTRKGAQEAAVQLSHSAMTFGHSNPFIRSKEQQERLKEASLSCSDKQMQSCIPLGGTCHVTATFEFLVFKELLSFPNHLRMIYSEIETLY